MLGNYFYVTLNNKNRLGTINMASSFQVHHILPVQLFNNVLLRTQLNEILGNTSNETKNTALQSYNNRIALYSDADRVVMILINVKN